jgi:hypothetical protein
MVNSQDIVKSTQAWLSHITSPIDFKKNIFLFSANDLQALNPTLGIATQEYINGNAKALTSATSDAPQSIYDGLQTIVNLCRVRSQFNPLDPGNFGTEPYFLAFTQQIAQVPVITLENSSVQTISQQSHNADELINSFMQGFEGLLQDDMKKIKSGLQQLVTAALSYSKEEQKQSNFTQNLLQKGDGKVLFLLYSSKFTIVAEKKKGTIKFESHYILHQAEYSLSESAWERVREQFASLHKTSMDDWLKKVTTPPDPSTLVTVPCLMNKVS